MDKERNLNPDDHIEYNINTYDEDTADAKREASFHGNNCTCDDCISDRANYEHQCIIDERGEENDR